MCPKTLSTVPADLSAATSALLLIDPQNDFCDLPASIAGVPALPVTGANADMQRVANLIAKGGSGLDDIVITLDSHHRVDIAHPTFWRTGDGAAVAPFTTITAAQVRAGEFVPAAAVQGREGAGQAVATVLQRVLAYLDALEAQGRYSLMVWPVHCEIGTWGHNVHSAVRAAYNQWEDRRLRQVLKVTKGDNPWTEHYSALQAEVPDPDDAATWLNRSLLARLDAFDTIWIAGEASSHCVKATTEHLADHLPSGRLGKLVLLTDGMSAVGGFEAQAADFIARMRERGVQTATCAQALAVLTQRQ
jgi:nicotinamidase-related amidase